MRKKTPEEIGLLIHFKWLINSVIVPITCALISAVVFIKITKRPTTIVYREIPIIEKFNVLEYFPLQPGNYWIYNYRYRLTKLPEKGSKVPNIEEGNVKFKMFVEELYEPRDYSLIVIKGDIFRGEKDRRYGFLVVSNKFYYIDEEKLDIAIQATKSGEMLIYKYFEDVNLFFEFPLYNGQKYGKIDYLTRGDLSYFWFVERTDSYFVEIDKKLDTRSTFIIKEATAPADASITFIPYLGIIGTTYNHHGTVDDREMNLVDYMLKEN